MLRARLCDPLGILVRHSGKDLKGYGTWCGEMSLSTNVTELVRSTAEAASAYIRGDIRRYLTLIKHGDDYKVMAPYGGEPTRGFDAKEALEATPKMFRGGEADPGARGVICFGRYSGARSDRTAARRGRRNAGSGLVAARNLGL